MATTKIDEVSVTCFINRGPFLDNYSPDKLFSSKNILGTPMEMEIHSSVDNFYRYGYIIFYDETGIRESLPLTGNEILSIAYKNSFKNLTESMPAIVHFNIFDIEEVVMNPAAFDSKRYTGKLLKFHLIETPFFLKYNNDVWRTAFGADKGDESDNRMYLHDIFTKHFKDNLKLIKDDPKQNIIETNFSKMSTKTHFVVPAWKSQKLFLYLLQFAKDENGYSNVKFFTTSNNESGRPVVNLISLNQMFKTKPNEQIIEFTHISDGDLIGTPKNLGRNSLNQILSFKFLSYDLSSLPDGFSGGHLLNRDYLTGQYFVHYDNYEEANKRKENAYVSNFALWSNTISNSNSKQYYFGQLSKDEAVSYLNNKTTKQKYQLRCEIMTYIDESLYVGNKVLMTFPSGMSEQGVGGKQEHLFDEHMSDEWIIQDIVDSYKDGKGLRKMTVIKDAFFNMYGSSTGSDSKPLVPQVPYVNSKG